MGRTCGKNERLKTGRGQVPRKWREKGGEDD